MDVGIIGGVVVASGGSTVGISLFRGCLVGSIAVVSVLGDCGILFFIWMMWMMVWSVGEMAGLLCRILL